MFNMIYKIQNIWNNKYLNKYEKIFDVGAHCLPSFSVLLYIENILENSRTF